jgi:acyl-CoA synthetase (AMP-forming)/AMP-acid ligase II
VDPDGLLHISDRKKDVIVSGGENISSLEVEACLLEHPDIEQAAVVGVPDDRWGETPKAVVVVAPGRQLSPADVIGFCRERIAGFKCPTQVEMRADLPRTATGKVQKFLLRPPAAGGEGPG